MEEKPANPMRVTAASLPPAKMTSAKPRLHHLKASPIAWEPEAHALTSEKFGPWHQDQWQ